MADSFTPPDLYKIFGKMLPIADQATVAILALQTGSVPKQHGTGTLFQVANRHFLVSAAHVASLAHLGSVPLYLHFSRRVIDNKEFDSVDEAAFPSTVVPLKERVAITCGGEDDAIDLAIWDLNADTVSSLRSKDFQNRSHVDPTAVDNNDVYFVYGFPEEMTAPEGARRIVARSAAFLARAADAGKCSMTNYSPDRHLLLDGDMYKPAGKPVKSLKGVSGASIWRTNCSPQNLGSWEPGMARIVAVETCIYEKSRLVRGTRWQTVFNALMAAYPELIRPLTNLLLRK
jgi:hypothetical protein